MIRKIYLLRHGEIASSTPKRFVGQQEYSLTQKGRKQMQRAAVFLQEHDIRHLVSSPLGRCRESAALLEERLGLPNTVVPGLREISLGRWEGLTVAEVQQQFPGAWEARGRDLAGFRPAEGESFHELQQRVLLTFFKLQTDFHRNLAIVAHAGCNRALLCHLLDIPLSSLFHLEQDYGCINILKKKKENYSIELLNFTPGKHSLQTT